MFAYCGDGVIDSLEALMRVDIGNGAIACEPLKNAGILQRPVKIELKPQTKLSWRWIVEELPKLVRNAFIGHDELFDLPSEAWGGPDVLRLPFPQYDGGLTPYTFELGYPLLTLVYDTLTEHLTAMGATPHTSVVEVPGLPVPGMTVALDAHADRRTEPVSDHHHRRTTMHSETPVDLDSLIAEIDVRFPVSRSA